MRVDAFPQLNSPAALQPRQETAGEREPDGDQDDMGASAVRGPSASLRSALVQPAQQQAAAQVAPQTLPQGMGTKVDLFA